MTNSLLPFFSPRGVAIVGASSDPMKETYIVTCTGDSRASTAR
jgi:hypothetical protein